MIQRIITPSKSDHRVAVSIAATGRCSQKNPETASVGTGYGVAGPESEIPSDKRSTGDPRAIYDSLDRWSQGDREMPLARCSLYLCRGIIHGCRWKNSVSPSLVNVPGRVQERRESYIIAPPRGILDI